MRCRLQSIIVQLRGGNAVSIQHFIRYEDAERSTLVITHVKAVCKRHILDVPVRNISQQVFVFSGRHQLESQLFLHALVIRERFRVKLRHLGDRFLDFELDRLHRISEIEIIAEPVEQRFQIHGQRDVAAARMNGHAGIRLALQLGDLLNLDVVAGKAAAHLRNNLCRKFMEIHINSALSDNKRTPQNIRRALCGIVFIVRVRGISFSATDRAV